MIRYFEPGDKKCSRCGLVGIPRMNPHTHEAGALWVNIRAGNKTDRLCEPCAQKLVEVVYRNVPDPSLKKRRAAC